MQDLMNNMMHEQEFSLPSIEEIFTKIFNHIFGRGGARIKNEPTKKKRVQKFRGSGTRTKNRPTRKKRMRK